MTAFAKISMRLMFKYSKTKWIHWFSNNYKKVVRSAIEIIFLRGHTRSNEMLFSHLLSLLLIDCGRKHFQKIFEEVDLDFELDHSTVQNNEIMITKRAMLVR